MPTLFSPEFSAFASRASPAPDVKATEPEFSFFDGLPETESARAKGQFVVNAQDSIKGQYGKKIEINAIDAGFRTSPIAQG